MKQIAQEEIYIGTLEKLSFIRSLVLKKKEKKHPNDYPLLSFRLDEETKDEITIEVESLVEVLNKKRDENSYVIRKNDVFVEALKEGLKIMRKKYTK